MEDQRYRIEISVHDTKLNSWRSTQINTDDYQAVGELLDSLNNYERGQ